MRKLLNAENLVAVGVVLVALLIWTFIGPTVTQAVRGIRRSTPQGS